MQARSKLSKSAGRSGGNCRVARSVNARSAGSKHGHSFTRQTQLDVNKFESSSAFSSDSGGSSQRSGSAASEASVASGDSDPGQTTNISSSSDAILKRYESFMNRMSLSGNHRSQPNGANTSNQQRATRRRAARRDSPQPTSPLVSWRRLGDGGSSRGRYAKGTAAYWDDQFPDQTEVYDGQEGRFEEPRGTKLSVSSEKARGGNPALGGQKRRQMQRNQRQHRQQPPEPQSDSIYYGNHFDSDVLERKRSLRHLCSLRSRRFDSVTSGCQKSGDKQRLVSDEDNDFDELSPKALPRTRNRQQHQQKEQLLVHQRQPMQRQNTTSGRRGSPLRRSDHLFDAYRSKIYREDAPPSACSRHGTWLPPPGANLQPPSPPALADDSDTTASEGPRGIGGDDRQLRLGNQDNQFLIDLIDLIAYRVDKLHRRTRRRSFALLNSELPSHEEGVLGPMSSPADADAELREGRGTAPWASRQRQKAAAGQQWSGQEVAAEAGNRGTRRVSEGHRARRQLGAAMHGAGY